MPHLAFDLGVSDQAIYNLGVRAAADTISLQPVEELLLASVLADELKHAVGVHGPRDRTVHEMGLVMCLRELTHVLLEPKGLGPRRH